MFSSPCYAENYAGIIDAGLFYNNIVIVGGGAATVLTNLTYTLQDNSTINFSNNHAQYGATVFLDVSTVIINGSDKNSINFTNNIARIVGNSIYIHMSRIILDSF